MKNHRVKSPSPHCSLAFLKGLQNSNYISETGIEYCAEEVDSLIWQKQESIWEVREADERRKNRIFDLYADEEDFA